MKRFSAIFVFGLITGLWLKDDVCTAAVTSCDPGSMAAADGCRTADSQKNGGGCGSAAVCAAPIDRPTRRRRRRPRVDAGTTASATTTVVTGAGFGSLHRRRDRHRAKNGLQTAENVLLYAVGLFYDQIELVLHLTLYKMRYLYTNIIEPIITSLFEFYEHYFTAGLLTIRLS